MKTRNGKAHVQMVGAMCFVCVIMATWATRAYAQDQAPAGQQTPAGSAQPAPVHFYSLGGYPRTHPSALNITNAANLQPKYPPQAIRAHHEGTVLVMAQIGVDGQVTDTRIEQSSGYRELDDSAATAVSGWKFRPAQRDGVPVVSWTRVPVNFSLPKTAATP
jgi:protein TonB